MKKIKTLFERDLSKQPSMVINKVNEGCEWVINGEGKATRKYDGCCCMIKDNELYKRREVKKDKTTPEGFEEINFDEITGKRVGWLKVNKDDPSDKYFVQAKDKLQIVGNFGEETYELLGKGSQGDIEKAIDPILQKHSEAEVYEDCPRTFDEIKEWFKGKNIEGIVWHHADGGMVKLKKKDFGLKRED